MKIIVKNVRIFLPPLIVLASTLACYYRLLIHSPDGDLLYTAIRWDLRMFSYLRFIFNSDAIRNGVFPLWNPYLFGGCPWISNFQACLFYPINLLIIFISGYSAVILQYQQIFTISLGGLAMYYCARRFHVSPSAALLSAISLIGCGFFVATGSHFQLTNTFAVFPFCFAATQRVIHDPRWRSVGIGAPLFAIMISAGYPTMALFMMTNCFIYGLATAIFIRVEPKVNARLRAICSLIAMLLIGAMLSSVFLLPAFESYPLLTRAGGRDTSPEVVINRSLHPNNLINIIFPYLALRNFAPYKLDLTFRNCSFGLIGLWLAAYYLLFGRGRLKYVVCLLLIINVVCALGFYTPIYYWAYRYLLPFRIASQPAADFRGAFLFYLCLAAGLGADQFPRRRREEINKLSIACLIVVGIGIPLLFSIGTKYGVAVAKTIVSEYQWLIILLVFLVAINIRTLKKYLPALLIFLTIIDVSYWTRNNFKTVGRLARPGEWSILKNAEKGRNRSVIQKKDFQRSHEYPDFKGAWAMFDKTYSDSGYDSTKLKHIDDIMNSPASGILSETDRIYRTYEVRLLDRENKVLDEIRQGTDLSCVALINLQDIRDDILKRKLEGLAGAHGNRNMAGKFKGDMVYCSPNTIKYAVDLGAPGVLLFNEVYYPGWNLKAGGQELPLFRINYAYRGTYLEAGRYELVMTYDPNSFKIGVALSAMAGLLCLGAVIPIIFRYH